MEIGSFDTASQTLVVSDPCYMPGTWCQVLVEPIQRGRWLVDALVDEEGHIQKLRAYHSEHQPVSFGLSEVLDGQIAVENQVVGIFDAAFYRDVKVAEPVEDPMFGLEGSEWVDMCIDRSHRKGGAGVIPYGVAAAVMNTPKSLQDGQGYEVCVERLKTGLISAVELCMGR